MESETSVQINRQLPQKLLQVILRKASFFMSTDDNDNDTKTSHHLSHSPPPPSSAKTLSIQQDPDSSTSSALFSSQSQLLSSVCSEWAEIIRTDGSEANCHQKSHLNGYVNNGYVEQLNENAAEHEMTGRREEEDATEGCTQQQPSQTAEPETAYRLFRRRWLIVFMFAVYSGSNAYQWIHLVIIGDKIMIYYNASLPDSELGQQMSMDWMSMIYMAVYIPLIFPATWLLDKRGLRLTAILGCLLNAVGAWLKCAAVDPSRFALLFFAQTVCGIAQVFILGIPPRLAAVWFGSNEVSTATSIGVFGNQLGSAVGFVIPPLIVSSYEIDAIGHSLSLLLYVGAGVMTLLFILVIIFFRSNPPIPPSQAQVTAAITWSNEDYCGSLRRLMTNVGFILLLITYGLNTGSFYEISTLLNAIVLYYFPDATTDAGNIGLTMILTGILGSILAGIWLDKTKKYKLTTIGIYFLSFAGMVAFTFTLSVGHIWIVYLCIGILGFFMTGYLPVGFEFAAELTFPESEGTSSGLLNASAQIFGIVLILGVRPLTNLPNGMLGGNLLISAALLLGTIGTAFIKSDLRRQAAQQKTLPETNETTATDVETINAHTYSQLQNSVDIFNVRDETENYCKDLPNGTTVPENNKQESVYTHI